MNRPGEVGASGAAGGGGGAATDGIVGLPPSNSGAGGDGVIGGPAGVTPGAAGFQGLPGGAGYLVVFW